MNDLRNMKFVLLGHPRESGYLELLGKYRDSRFRGNDSYYSMPPITDQTPILTVGNVEHKKFLDAKTRDFPFAEFSKSDLQKLITTMRRIMKRALGVGLSANQIGLPYRMFVAEVAGKGEKSKFYAVFNPVIEKTTGEPAELEEGCLSVPELYGNVKRFPQVTLSGLDKNQKPFRIRAWGVLAHVFQHEVDHLNGLLFSDKTKDVYKPKSAEIGKSGN